MTDQLLLLRSTTTGLRLAVCTGTALAREAAQRHELAAGSAAALAQGLVGTLLLATTDRPDSPLKSRVDVHLECGGPLKGLLVDADGSGAVRGLVRVGSLDRSGARSASTEIALGREPSADGGPLSRFDAARLIGGQDDTAAGMLSILRRIPTGGTSDDVHRGAVPFSGGDLGAGLSAFLRSDRMLAGEIALEVLFREGEPLAAVAGAMILPDSEDEVARAREIGGQLRAGLLREPLQQADREGSGNAHALAAALSAALGLGQLQIQHEVRARFACRCTRDRVVRALMTLAADELRDMAGRDGGASATCDFCAARYDITAPELLELASGRSGKDPERV